MTNKRRTKELQQGASLRRRRVMERFIGPYDCPKCFAIKSMMISKISQTTERDNEKKTWLVQCGKCNFWKKVELPILMQKIDIINKVGDLMRADI